MDIPVLYFSFANQADRHLSMLEEELEFMEDNFWDIDYQNKIKFKRDGKTEIKDIFKTLPRYREHLVLFHYAGHATGIKLEFADQAAHAQGIADFFKDYPALKLVFLNGCSTYDQVKGLLKSGVQAVIATSVEINDIRAKEFACEFYRVFKLGHSLQQAYNHAVQSILTPGEHLREPEQIGADNISVEKVTIADPDTDHPKTFRIAAQPIHTKTRGQGLPPFDGTIPWGLYYAAPDILDWKLADVFPQQEQVDLQALLLRQKETEKQRLETEFAQLDIQVNTLYEQIQEAVPADLADLQTKWQEAKSKKMDMQARLSRLESAINAMQAGSAGKLYKAFNRINYKEQIDFFSQWKNSKQVGAFLLQGTAQCGHSLFLEEIAPNEVLNFTRDRFRQLRLSVQTINHNNTYDEANIWNTLQIVLQPRRRGRDTAGVVANEIKSILEKQHLVLLFYEVTHLAAKAIADFWISLQDLLKPAHLDLQSAYPNRLMLVLVDEMAELVKDEQSQTWQATSLPRFQAAFAAHADQAPEILRPITPLDLSELRGWRQDSELPPECWINDQGLEALHQASNGYVLPVIRAYCEQIGQSAFFEEYYGPFEYK